MIELIDQFVQFTVGVASWRLFAAFAIFFLICGLISLERKKTIPSSLKVGVRPRLWLPFAIPSTAALIFFAAWVLYLSKQDERKILLASRPTVIKLCTACRFEGGHLKSGTIGKAEDVAQGQWFVAVNGLDPIEVDRIPVLPVYGAYSNNPRYGFDDNKTWLVIWDDVSPTDELSSRRFNRWEVVFWTILLWLLSYWLFIVYERRRLQAKLLGI